MNTNRNKIAISIGAMAASGLLTLAVPTGTSQAIVWKPPMPCIAVQAGLYPVGAGFCHTTTGGFDSNKIVRRLQATGVGTTASVYSTHTTPSPT